VYAKSIKQAGTGERMTALVRGVEWAPMGTNDAETEQEQVEAVLLPFAGKAS
jgi:hypothetical protein